jgi:hypothetical protein
VTFCCAAIQVHRATQMVDNFFSVVERVPLSILARIYIWEILWNDVDVEQLA